MDFGDILDKWEKQGPQTNREKPANTGAETYSQGKPNPMDAWIRTN